MLGVVVAVVAALLVIGAVVTYRMARSNDTVESFRRQIDALSPEARRGVVDQVNRIDDAATDAATPEPDVPDASNAPDARPADPPAADTAGPPDDDIAGRPDDDIAGRPDDDIAGRPDDERGS